MESTDTDSLKQLDDHLASTNQSWLFGAGICVDAGIPLMGPLTSRIFSIAQEKENDIFTLLNSIKEDLQGDSHIEHILSQIGDYITIAQRSKDKTITVHSQKLERYELRTMHNKILQWIADTIRWGFIPKIDKEPEQLGTKDKPIVKIDRHYNFISALFNRCQAGIAERRNAIKLFTINYDTLIEDALALGCFPYWDGFSGGAVAFRNYHYGDKDPEFGFRAHVIKLHGSIDWYLGEDERIWRVREGDLYPKKTSRVLIYPQATKYYATQRDPFAAQFDIFRRTLNSENENVLGICGYSYGDEHINNEIELALVQPRNKTTILAFAQSINPAVKSWLNSSWSRRLYVITSEGLYTGNEGPFFPPEKGKMWDWWKFEGVTKLLNSGAEACVQ